MKKQNVETVEKNLIWIYFNHPNAFRSVI